MNLRWYTVQPLWRRYEELDGLLDLEAENLYCSVVQRNRKLMYYRRMRAVVKSCIGGAIVFGGYVAFIWIFCSLFRVNIGVRFFAVLVLIGFVCYVCTPFVVFVHAKHRIIVSLLQSQLDSSTCFQCGYSLRGLESSSSAGAKMYVTCPECGTSNVRFDTLTPADS